MDKQDKKRGYLNSLLLFLIGGISGSVATLVIQPLDTLKVNIQVASEKLGQEGKANTLSIGNVWKVITKGGFQGLYRGLDSAILRQIFYTSARIGFYNYLIQKLKKSGEVITNTTKVLCSMASGGIGAIVGTPFDVALVRRQATLTNNKQPYRNTFHAFMDIIEKEGILGLWKGLNITILRVMLINVGQMASNDIIKTYLNNLDFGSTNKTLINSLSAFLASFITSAISLPADNIKVKLQKSMKGEGDYTGILDCLTKTLRREGFTKLWVGFPIYLIRGMPHSFILLSTQNYLMDLYKKHIH